MKPVEYLAKGTFNLILISMSTWDFIDPVFKLIGAAVGIVLSIFLIRKAWHDTELAKEQKRKLTLENEMKAQELYQMMEKSKVLRK
jgi:predicted membrane protein